MNNLETKETSGERCYYIYRHLRGSGGSGSPFYIGLGKHRPNANCPSLQYSRANAKGNDRSPFWNNIANKYGHTVEIMLDNLTKEEALAKEVELIALYGRIKDGGLLCNLTSGGEGVFDLSHSESTCEYFRELYTTKIEDVEENVFPEPNTGCHLWAGTLDARGRPKVNVSRKAYATHRFLFEYYTGTKLSDKDLLLRTCDNPLCVNVDHMAIGDISDVVTNKKARGAFLRGEQHRHSKLTEDLVLELRNLYREGQRIVDIAKEYNLPVSTIGQMLRGKTWAWLNG